MSAVCLKTPLYGLTLKLTYKLTAYYKFAA